MKKLKILLLSLLVIICINIVMAETLPEMSLSSCAMTNSDIRAVNGLGITTYPSTNTSISVLRDALASKIKADGELDVNQNLKLTHFRG